MNTQPKLERWERRAEWPLAAVAIAFLAVYSEQVLGRPHGLEAAVLGATSWVIWSIFVVDYLARLTLANDRRRWFVTHLLELAVVALPLLRPLRLLRLVILVGALQKAVGDAIRGRIVVYTVGGVALLIYVGSLAVLEQERDQPDALITSFGKALWWSITTVTTVGYGDLYPMTTTGRVVAVLLMLGGISLIGVVTASLASWIVQRVAEDDAANGAATAEQVEALQAEIRALADQLQNITTNGPIAERRSSP
ncbi:two pore domain potassium channel family protein [Mycolicibacterium sp. P1-18]|uniref:potassium channel family protein n=1 Tax=Mycolicibacterium sp. P1-18 TaxID=2024615 RepID=UPI0011F30C0F|nr:potassium channel family protein [Mycolicibacterium sp. P1-18]KAA0096150.1 two pore domain potassium channel family protein [Mycolicibacterium sp. P1-18]